MEQAIGMHHLAASWELARLERRADSHAGLVARAQPLLQELADKFNESVTLSVPNAEGSLDLIAQASGSHVLGVLGNNMIGQRYSLHASSTGKVLLAEQPPEKLRSVLPEKLEAYTPHTITDRAALLKEDVFWRD